MTFEVLADNLRESFRIVAESRSGELRELPGVSVAAACTAFQMFNAAFLSRPALTEAELLQRILLPALHFQTRGLEWAYWVCEDLIESRTQRRARRVFEKNGLRLSVELPGMAAEQVLPPAKPLPRLEVRRVHVGATRDAFCAIGSSCFHVPLGWFTEVFDSPTVWQRFESYVGYVDGEPVSTAAIVQSGDVLGVYNVATVPGHQRRGYAEAVMRHALEDAWIRHGKSGVILQSTPAGLRLYQRMGFRTITQVAVYAS
jgi:ribosomal protein S18 acetylase RimI-like enzyme